MTSVLTMNVLMTNARIGMTVEEWRKFIKKNLLGRTCAPNILRDWEKHGRSLEARIAELEEENKQAVHAAFDYASAIDEKDARIDELEGNMGFENFINVATRWLENYPPDIFDGSSNDSGPLFVVALRKAIREVEGEC